MRSKEGSIVQPPSDVHLSWFEDAYRVELPSDFRAFLQEANGAVPIDNQFMFNGKTRQIELFLPLFDDPKTVGSAGWSDITVVMTQLDLRLIDDEELVGMNVIPIAGLFGGDYLCLDFRKSGEAPCVSVWLHEYSDDFAPDLTKVADSFGEFLQKLHA